MTYNNLFQLDSWSQLASHDNLDTIVIAEQDIPSGFQSLPACRPIPIKKILKPCQPKHLIKAYVSELGVVETREKVDWIHLIRLADNCFEQNVLIHWDTEKKSLLLTTIKQIKSGVELKAWFASDLLNFLNVPFLSPSNIVNISNYQCNYCESTFSQPNPLKIHLAFDCPIQLTNQSNHRHLYNHHRLIHQSPNVSLNATFGSPSNVSLASLFFSNNSISNSTGQIVSQLNRPLVTSQSSSPLSAKISGTSSSSSSSLSSLSSRETCSQSNTKETPEALTNISPQPTTVVTSTLFGTKEPRSHICVFCGKLYTRKYGLKIHLRTHTGHKPLSCRFCGRPFSDPSNLNKHIRLHSQHHSGSVSSPYKCKKCPKILVRRRDLERHLKSRHKL
uniref:C2H2-type domain-containing protein n=2 Tax=Tetranychus urticae TaxID=32264 RepID=T1KF20_TETUR